MQTHINRILFLLILFSYTLFGCTLCTIYSPETKVSLNIQADEKTIKTADVTWVLTKEFTDYLKEIYDTNQDNYLDKKELEPVEESLLDYIAQRNYLTHISYGNVVNKKKSKKIDVETKRAYIKNGLLHFDYKINLNYELIKDNVLYFNFNDEENYFILLLAKNAVKFNAPFDVQKVLSRQGVAFNIGVDAKPSQEIKEAEEIEIKDEKKEENLLSSYSKKVKEHLVKIQRGDDYALFVLLAISFLYGIIHALGPGHGKSLAFTYFASNKTNFSKAFIISQASAFIHIIGALILVMVSVFLLESVLNNFVNDSVEILTKVSAVMIILLAIYILYNKLAKKDCSCSSCCSAHEPKQTGTWSTTKPSTQTNLKPNFMKKDLYFVLTAGLIPCPGTVVLFIYAFVLKTYVALFLASIAISFGMGLVIFAASFLGVSVHKLSERSHRLTNILEILAPIVMFTLGVLLYLNANLM